jgi:hypothetical protein
MPHLQVSKSKSRTHSAHPIIPPCLILWQSHPLRCLGSCHHANTVSQKIHTHSTQRCDLVDHRATDAPQVRCTISLVGHLLRERAQYNITPKIFQSDRGGEFTSADFSAYLESHGIICKLTVHNTPEHNGAAERAWRTLLNIVWMLLFASNLPQKLWGEALQHAIYVYNRLPHSILGGRSPYEARFKTTPNLSNLWEFGSWVFVHITTNDKLAPQAAECRWIGFDPSSNGHRIYWPDRQVISVERSL